LRRAGYATAIAGKWQINDLRPEPDILARHGFQRHCMWPGVEEGNPPSSRRYWDAYLQTDGTRKVHTDEYGPDVTQRFALEFIRENKARPFLLYYPMISVHGPNEPTPLNRATPPKGEAALYAGSVTYMDRQIGELLDELDRLGIAQNTVVIFTGDNGSSTGGTHAGRAVFGQGPHHRTRRPRAAHRAPARSRRRPRDDRPHGFFGHFSHHSRSRRPASHRG
jgi:arylsulfatase A-like enzyme